MSDETTEYTYAKSELEIAFEAADYQAWARRSDTVLAEEVRRLQAELATVRATAIAALEEAKRGHAWWCSAAALPCPLHCREKAIDAAIKQLKGE